MIDGQTVGFSETGTPDPEVTPKAKRRSFSASYKKKILAEVDSIAPSPVHRDRRCSGGLAEGYHDLGAVSCAIGSKLALG